MYSVLRTSGCYQPEWMSLTRPSDYILLSSIVAKDSSPPTQTKRRAIILPTAPLENMAYLPSKGSSEAQRCLLISVRARAPTL